MIEFIQISKAYEKDKRVLDDISLQVLPNQICCLLGKNGSGKSTLINILAQMIKPDTGHILINHREVHENTILVNERLGIVSQFDYLIDQLSGYQFLTFQCLIFKMAAPKIKSRIESLTSYFFDHPADIHKPIKSYSSGMRMKIKVIAALLHKPTVLVMDEPFANLDLVASEKLILLLKEFAASVQNTVLISSHDLLYVNLIASQICVLDNQRLVFNGEKSEFTENNQFAINKQLLDMVNTQPITTHKIDWLF